MATKKEAIDAVLGSRLVSLEFADFFLGELLGSGTTRYVFASTQNPKQVIKIDMSDQFANAMEFKLWERVMYVEGVKDWFAPCYEISSCGCIMTQALCTKPKKYPEKVPRFFTDLKRQNFGMYKGKFVCFDYALNLMMEEGMKTVMTKAKWWDI